MTDSQVVGLIAPGLDQILEDKSWAKMDHEKALFDFWFFKSLETLLQRLLHLNNKISWNTFVDKASWEKILSSKIFDLSL